MTRLPGVLDSRHVRAGDPFPIRGDYQYHARTQGPVVQRFWHAEKERIVRTYAAPQPGQRVLDVGCGSGVITDLLATLGAHATGIDANPAAIEFARARYPGERLDFQLAQIEDLPFEPGSIDRIYSLELVEHLYERQAVALLTRFRALLRPGGSVLLTTPNYRGAWPIIEFALDSLRLVPQLRDAQHVTRFNRGRLRAAVERSGLRIQRLTTFSTLAPFLSPISWRFAERVADLEDRLALPFGNVLLAVAVKP